ncbi:MAG: acyl-CoA thioesterase [Spirochaetales bacterium]|nr:acyl-CoA thioesterase [Spirochaetales bacterium]
MENMIIVRPEHLNHYGYLFGGQLLKWVDEFAWIAATREFPGNSLVTRAMDKIEFKERVNNGSILRFAISLEKKGTSSLTYLVEVYADEQGATHEKYVFSTKVVFACIDSRGKKSCLK